MVNLNGFVRLVDAARRRDDHDPARAPRRPLSARERDAASCRSTSRPASQHLNGHRALMYARSRHQDSDYGRMRRQQAVLLALRSRLKPCKLIPKIPTLLKIARDDAWTSFKPKDLPSLLSLAAADRCEARQDADVRAADLPRGDQRQRDQADPQGGPGDLPERTSRSRRRPRRRSSRPIPRTRRSPRPTNPIPAPDVATRDRSAAAGAGRGGRRSAARRPRGRARQPAA